MRLTDDSFRALARSSPWRFSALHFTRRATTARPEGAVEAWLRRPGWLRVLLPDGSERIETGVPYSSSTFSVTAVGAVQEMTSEPPHQAEPTYRPDGLVARRPDAWVWSHADPMFENYQWVAMLDPAELASGTVLSELREDVLFGRPVWRARAAAVDGYDPVCSCCPLLWSSVSDDLEYGDSPRRPQGRAYPQAYNVALDVGTGVVVSLRPVGGSRPDDWFEVEIHGVDQTANVPPLRQ
ncbi:hypothetical protein [Nocardioides sp. CER19]|uniref:hypothetical protein n=1 Tax=Nocardioides sp. CER19 TaxID=3038538 RepID=UPI00244789F1|nr:hypothetical protein [Nocardioides sp. CER19]MDH2413472.1 hypothetical protein [Nocardioides sp. CER19]